MYGTETSFRLACFPLLNLIYLELYDAFGTRFSDEEVDTVGGLVMQAFGHLPTRGETIEIDNYQFKVAMADSRKIIQLHVKIPDDAPIPSLDEDNLT